jgi:hypothetical protein
MLWKNKRRISQTAEAVEMRPNIGILAPQISVCSRGVRGHRARRSHRDEMARYDDALAFSQRCGLRQIVDLA